MNSSDGFRMAIDIGGTFTDTVLMNAEGNLLASAKTPTTPAQPALAALDGAMLVLDQAKINWRDVHGLVHGTTLATNALIERRGAKVATVTTEGFRDILEIAYERRYSQYAINIEKPDLIVPRSRSFTIGGRMDARGQELMPLDETNISALVNSLQTVGAEAVAICLLHSYANPAHELKLRDLLKIEMPDLVISLSHEVSPEAREFDRLCTTIANAYVQPLMAGYLTDFQNSFIAKGLTCPILMMTASGGMTTIETASRLPIRLVESGPAGGAILAARIAREVNEENLLSFDMGGTTAKLCLIDGFRPQTARKFEISRAERFIKGSGMPVRIPVIEMIEIGAGGGSIAKLDRLGRLQVGPESAGSEPGPAAFKKGGDQPTVTDADIIQGYIQPDYFAEGRLEIDVSSANQAIQRDLAEPLGLVESRAAFALSDIVDENMAAAGRMHAVESGKDLSRRMMIAFGGNGPLHATRVARRAQVERILIPANPGVGSAVGFLFAPVSFEIIRSYYSTLETLNPENLNQLFEAMIDEATKLVRSGAPNGPLSVRRVAFMRYHGQGHEIEIELPDRPLDQSDLAGLKSAFEIEYARQFNRVVPGMTIEILNWGLSVSGPASDPLFCEVPTKSNLAKPREQQIIICDLTGKPVKAGVFFRDDLLSGDHLDGPALIIEPQTTTLVSADFQAHVDSNLNIRMTKRSNPS